MDRQTCDVAIGSFFYEYEDVRFVGSLSYNESTQQFLQYEFNLTEMPEKERFNYYRQGEPEEEIYSTYGARVSTEILCRVRIPNRIFQVHMRRIFQPFLLRSYLPSAIFVVVSWISFTIDPTVVPGRMALLVTILLMLINISNSVSSMSPLAESLTAIEVRTTLKCSRETSGG